MNGEKRWLKRHEALALADSLRLHAFNRGMAWARGDVNECERRTRQEHEIREEIVQLICNRQDEDQS